MKKISLKISLKLSLNDRKKNTGTAVSKHTYEVCKYKDEKITK